MRRGGLLEFALWLGVIGICIGCAIYNTCTARRDANSVENLRDEDQKTRTVAFSEFLNDVRDGRLSEVKITAKGTLSEYEYERVDTNGGRERKIAMGIADARMTKDIIDNKVKVTVLLADERNPRGSIFVTSSRTITQSR